MELKSLYLRNFRNYKEATFTFAPGINAIIGKNGEGKTNLLEAIYFLITGKSFRLTTLAPLISFGASFFYLEAHFVKDGIDGCLKITCDGKERRIIHNATPLTKLSSLFGILLGVVLTPEDQILISGPPAIRRRFLDLHIAQFSPHYLFHLSRYAKALRIRNELLRREEMASIEIWESEMASSASHIMCARVSAIEELNSAGHELGLHLSGERDDLHIDYRSKISFKEKKREEIEKEMQRCLSELRPKEIERGTTLVGPHRDDLVIHLQEKEARLFASEGQKRSCVAALRLAEWARLKKITEEVPLMCIDDVGISLDPQREKYLHKELGNLGQAFFTSPKMNLTFPGAHVIHLESALLEV